MKNAHGISDYAKKNSREARLSATPFPCGKCLPCRIFKAREWQHRIMLETMTSSDSVFITLTYEREPLCKSVCPRHITLFLKRLRKRLKGIKIRYFICGEYGEIGDRPHYHGILWGIGKEFKFDLTNAWKKGFIYLGDVNKDTARYVSGYLTKNTDNHHYTKNLLPEFQRCSRMNGGIGLEAIKGMAEKLKRSPYYEPQIHKFIQYGKKKMPLGKYLMKKMSEEVGISQEQRETDLFLWQDEMFNDFMTDDGSYYQNLVEGFKSNQDSLIKRHKIFKLRRKVL